MVKTILVVGVMLLMFSAGLVIRDWSSSEDDVSLLSEDDMQDNKFSEDGLSIPPKKILLDSYNKKNLVDKDNGY